MDVAQELTQPAQPEDKEKQESVDAKVSLFADDGYMKVELGVSAPVGEGRAVTMEDLRAALKSNGVVYGIDEEALTRLAAPLYGERVVVARGTPAQDGANGTCHELFTREVVKKLTERADGSVDYKNIGAVRDIRAGTVLCEITQPTPGVPGKNTKGETLKAIDGVKAVVPAGENTSLSADGSCLEAAASGNLLFRDHRFCVETVVRVSNVDYDTGNISFSGDVVIAGDVKDGFEVRAGGSITLRGQAGAVLLHAGKDITVESGLNGSGRAVLEAGSVMKAGFIENATLIVGEKLIAQTLMNCQVECEGDVEATGGKGIICGGKITTFGSVKAKKIGNESNMLTVIVMGVTPKLLAERKRLVEQQEDVSRHIDEIKKNVAYIERMVRDGRPVPPDRVQMLKRSQLQLPMTEKKLGQLNQSLAELETKLQDVGNSQLQASVVYPPTKVSIGALSTNVIDQRNNCRVYKNSQGELTIGNT